jgi:hypothetical protein
VKVTTARKLSASDFERLKLEWYQKLADTGHVDIEPWESTKSFDGEKLKGNHIRTADLAKRAGERQADAMWRYRDHAMDRVVHRTRTRRVWLAMQNDGFNTPELYARFAGHEDVGYWGCGRAGRTFTKLAVVMGLAARVDNG